MRLRTALKIEKAVGTPDQARYSNFQIDRAYARIARTRSGREANRFSRATDQLGVDGRAWLLDQLDHTGDVFKLLMRQGG